MPIQSPGYDIPTFPPTGNEEVDNALSQWTASFGQQYREAQEAVERTPFIVTTVTADNGAVGGALLTKRVQFHGGEQVVAFGYFDLQVSAGGALTSIGISPSQTARGKLRLVYPGGTVTTFGAAQEATLGIGFQGDKSSNLGGAVRTTVVSRANVSFVWPISVKFQTGGEHTFQLRTTGGGTFHGGQLTLVVL